MKRETVATAFLVAVILGVLYLCFLMVSPFLSVLAWAIVLAIVFYPLHRRMLRFIRRPGIGALVSCLVVSGIVIAPTVLMVMALVGELADAYQLIEKRVLSGVWRFSLEPGQSTFLSRSIGWLNRYVDLSEVNLPSLILTNLQRLSTLLVNKSTQIIQQFSTFVFKGALVLFTLYFLFRDADALLSKIKELIPLPPSETDQVLHRMRETINATIYGGVAVALAQGFLGGIAFGFLGLPSPVIWGVVMFFFSFLPVVGASIIWVPAVIVLLAQGHVGKGLFLLVWGVAVISMADNLIRPLVIKSRIRLHTLLIFFSILGGVQVFGVIGLIMGPVVLSVALALVEIFRRKITPSAEGVSPHEEVASPPGPAVAGGQGENPPPSQ
ncbi:MAG TPA: AI-2E family transporter [Blastocatellia bacterium]|nr:AI-2E family transporter [Blastocatellia bacterium]